MDAGGEEDQHKAGSESGGTSRRTLAEPDVPSAGVKVTLLSEGPNNVEENVFSCGRPRCSSAVLNGFKTTAPAASPGRRTCAAELGF